MSGNTDKTQAAASEPVDHLERFRALTRQQQGIATSLRELGEGFARAHLIECCVELLQQRESNQLATGGRMDELREILQDKDIYTAQRLVEALAAEYIARELGAVG